jgi:subtilisin
MKEQPPMADPTDAERPRETGGMIVMFHDGVDHKAQEYCLHHCIGAEARALSMGTQRPSDTGPEVPGVLLGDSGIAVVFARADTAAARTRLSADDKVAMIRPEFWMYALDSFQDSATATWGLQAVGADRSVFTGKGVKLCVLDTGIDLTHPDFQGRQIVTRSFVPNEGVEDGNSHGTHCAGTAAGGRSARGTPRYGVAPDADLMVGKVLGNNGAGRERDILTAILWAIEQGAAVISMSLGRAVQLGEGPSADYERVGSLALSRGSLIVAAAGNESARAGGRIAPVGAPANSPSIMAVAALDPNLGIADFSSGGVNPEGGQVDIAAPGVGILSSVPGPERYKALRGTSMACPHVAGLAALWAESDAGLRGRALWNRLSADARDVSLPARDAGAGLAQAPGIGGMA